MSIPSVLSGFVFVGFLAVASRLDAAPSIDTPPSSATPAYGATVTLSASVTAGPGATFAWMRDSTTPILNGGRYSGATTTSLTITGANSADNGSYVLTVTDGTGSTSSTPATITVTQSPGSLDPAYTGAGANGGSSSIYTNTALHLPDGRTLVATRGQFNPGTFANLTLLSAAVTATQPGGASLNGEVSSIFRMGDGKILLAGDFTEHALPVIGVGTVRTTLNRVARLNADFSLDSSFIPSGPLAQPTVIFADSLGRVYLGGSFVNYNSQSDYRHLVRLNPNGSLDTSFKPLLNGTVSSVVFQKDGKFIVGGAFVSRGNAPSTSVPGLVRFLTDGSLDTSYSPSFPEGFDTQSALAIDADDNLYVGRSGATGAVFKVLPSGSLANGFTSPSFAGQISALAVLPDGKIALGGFFTTPTSRIMVLNADGSQDTGFSVGTGLNSVNGATTVKSIVPDPSGRIWIMGVNFSTYNGNSANRLAVLQGNGGPRLAFTGQPTGRVANAASSVSFTAHATGNNGFTYLWHKNGSPLSNGGRFSGVDTNTLTISGLEEGDEGGYSVVVSSPGVSSITSRVAGLEVLGAPEITLDPVAQSVDFGSSATFTGAAVGATPLSYQWFYNDTALSNGTGVSGATSDTLTLTNIDFNDAGSYKLRASNGLGQDFSAVVTLTVQKRPGGIAASTNPLPMFNGEVHAICLLPDGSYVLGGAFHTVSMNGGSSFSNRSGLARILANGTLDTSFPTVGGSVHCVEVDSAGRIFIGGTITSVTSGTSTVNRINVARLVSSGSSYVLDTAFDTSTSGPDDIVYSLAPVGDGSVYIAGNFEKVGATADKFTGDDFTARLGPNGALASSYTSGASNTTYALLRNSNGSLYVGGSSNLWNETTLFPGTPWRRLVLVSAAGGRTASFTPPGTFPSFPIVHTMLKLADGSLLLGCNWIGSYVARVNGATGAMFTYTTAHPITVGALAQQPDGKVLIGSTLGMFTRNSPVDGTLDTSMDIGTGFDSGINDIKVDGSGRIFVAGNFTTYNGVTRNRFVILNGGDLDSRTQPKPGQTITFADIADRAFVPGNAAANTVTITPPTSSSGLPVTTVVTSGPATLAGGKLTFTGAGTVVLTASQAGNDNFSAASLSQTIEVSKAPQTLTFAPMIDRPTGSAPFLLSGSTSSGLPVHFQLLGGPATISGNLITLTGVTGTVSIRATQAGDANFADAGFVDQSFEVFEGVPALLPQVISFNPLPPRSANEAAFNVAATSTSGLPVTFTVTSGPASIAGSLVTLSGATGTVVITATQPGNANFLPAKPVSQSFKVGAPATSLTLANLVQTYTGTPRPISVIGGTADTIYYTVNKVKGTTPPTAAGSYAVEAVSGTGASAVKKSGTLTINKAPLTITADDKRRFVGQANPLLTFAYSGFLGSDNASNAFTKPPTISTKATPTSPGGSYPILPAGGSAVNYSLVYVNGNLEVESWGGQYEALLEKPGEELPVGKIEFTVAANSIDFTGKLYTAKNAAASFKGKLSTNLDAETATGSINAVVGSGSNAVTYGISLNPLPLDGRFTASVTRAEGTGAATAFGDTSIGEKLRLASGKPAERYAGAHTLIIDPPEHLTASVLPLPGGSGYATAVIDSKGKLTLAGALADGTKITASLLPDANRGYRLYLLPYSGRSDSYFAAWLDLVDHPDLTGRGCIPANTQSAFWAKAAPVPTSKDANYRDGFPEASASLILDPWLPPVAAKTPNPAITLLQRLGLGLSGDMTPLFDATASGLTSDLPTQLSLAATGKVGVVLPEENARDFKMTVAPATGVYSGSFTVPNGSKSTTVNFSGILRQPASGETDPAFLGGGFGLIPQLTGQTTGSTSTDVSMDRPGD
jgi:uncharacterized delta-60 repeat protein